MRDAVKIPSRNGRTAIQFSTYLRRLWRVVLSSSLAAGLVFGALAFLLAGSTFHINADIDLSRLSALVLIVGLPLAAMAFFLLLSPLSFWIFRRLPRDTDRTKP